MKKKNKDVRWNWVILMFIMPIVISIIDLMDLSANGNSEIIKWLNLIGGCKKSCVYR